MIYVLIFFAPVILMVLVQMVEPAWPTIRFIGRVLLWIIEAALYLVTWEWLFHNQRDRE